MYAVMDFAIVSQARFPWTKMKDDPGAWSFRPLPRVVFRDMLALTGLGWLDSLSDELRFVERLRAAVKF